jgi:hypothetical protein
MSYVRYANRTCYNCGAIHPQNEMTRTTVTRKTGQSKKTFNILDGNTKRRQDALWGLGGRTYYGNKEVWECQDCSVSPGGSSFENAAIGFAVIGALAIWLVTTIWNFIAGYVSIVVDIVSNNNFMDAIYFINMIEIAGISFTKIAAAIMIIIFMCVASIFQKKDKE